MSKTLQIGDVTVPGRVLMAPMTGITDLPFRRLASKLGAAYVATEMVAARELARARPDVVRRAAVGDGLPLTVVETGLARLESELERLVAALPGRRYPVGRPGAASPSARNRLIARRTRSGAREITRRNASLIRQSVRYQRGRFSRA